MFQGEFKEAYQGYRNVVRCAKFFENCETGFQTVFSSSMVCEVEGL